MLTFAPRVCVASGEAGAGKTTCTKHVVIYFAHVAADVNREIGQGETRSHGSTGVSDITSEHF